MTFRERAAREEAQHAALVHTFREEGWTLNAVTIDKRNPRMPRNGGGCVFYDNHSRSVWEHLVVKLAGAIDLEPGWPPTYEDALLGGDVEGSDRATIAPLLARLLEVGMSDADTHVAYDAACDYARQVLNEQQPFIRAVERALLTFDTLDAEDIALIVREVTP